MSESKNPSLLSVRCPESIMQAIAKQMEQTGLNKTAVVLEMLQNSTHSLPITERSKLPAAPGVYFVYTPSNKLLYIGSSSNLQRRWYSHHRYQQFIETSIETRIGWFVCDSDEELAQIEKDLITELDTSHDSVDNHPLTKHLSPEVREKLATWMSERGFNQVIPAVSTILDAYLQNKDIPSSAVETQDRLQFVEDELTNVWEQIDTIKNVLIDAGAKTIARRTKDIPRGLQQWTPEQGDVEKGLTKTELCSRLKTSIKTINENAAAIELSPEDYLLELSGWELKGARYEKHSIKM